MSMASSQQSFLANALSPTLKPRSGKIFKHPAVISISCGLSNDEHGDFSKKNENQLAKLAMVSLAAGVLSLGSVSEASATKTGGRVCRQVFRSAAPRSSSPIINNSRTNIDVNPPVAPPVVGGSGYGHGAPFYGGWGWSPFSFFMPGPSVAVGVGGGFAFIALFMVLGAAASVVRRFAGSRDEDVFK